MRKAAKKKAFYKKRVRETKSDANLGRKLTFSLMQIVHFSSYRCSEKSNNHGNLWTAKANLPRGRKKKCFPFSHISLFQTSVRCQDFFLSPSDISHGPIWSSRICQTCSSSLPALAAITSFRSLVFIGTKAVRPRRSNV